MHSSRVAIPHKFENNSGLTITLPFYFEKAEQYQPSVIYWRRLINRPA